MGYIIALLLKYGYGGMFVASFLAGSILPFSSEAIMTGLRLAGLDVWPLVICATLGNTLGGVFNYGVGRLGKEKWIYSLLHVKENKLEKSERFVHHYGAWMGLLSWLPVLGDVITIAMGTLHINIWKSSTTILIGKALRYIVMGLILQQI